MLRTLRARTRTLDVHHRIALRDGGAPHDPAKLEAVCRPCHRQLEKGAVVGSSEDVGSCAM
jgi:hypothetical protein